MRRTAAKIYRLTDARARAEKILPSVLFNYLDGGSSDEITLRENRRAFEEIRLRPHAAAIPEKVDLSTEIYGERLGIPLILSPVGGLRLMSPDADCAAQRAALAAGTFGCLSTMSGTPMEDVVAASQGKAWFQLYFDGGRTGAEWLVDRAQSAGFKAMCVTVDGTSGMGPERIVGKMDKFGKLRGDDAHDSAMPSTLSVRKAMVFAPQLVRHMAWTLGYVRDGVPRHFAQEQSSNPGGHAAPTDERTRPTWAEFEWIRKTWKGKLLIKGIVRGDDARRAIDVGADGIVVSNHGGRQVDTGIASLRALPEVRQAVGGDVPILLDGGIRRGGDIVKALALGANCVMMGRPYVYGLAAGGEAGARRILDIFRIEMKQSMEALGLSSIAEINDDCFDFARFNLEQRTPIGK